MPLTPRSPPPHPRALISPLDDICCLNEVEVSGMSSSDVLPSARDGGIIRPAKRNRVSIACASCRQRKSRCDGRKPRCTTCSDHSLSCVYSDGASLTKLSVSKEYFEALESRLAKLENSMTGLDNRVTHVERYQTEDPRSTTIHYQAQNTPTRGEMNLDGVDIDVYDSQDPTDGIGSVIFTKEDNSGFFGPSSNIAFTRQIVQTITSIVKSVATATNHASLEQDVLHTYVLNMSRAPSPTVDEGLFASKSTSNNEPYVLPEPSHTLEMIDEYFNTTGVLFPYIDQEDFVQTYRQLTSVTNTGKVKRSWLGLLNMVLAMSSHANHDARATTPDRASEVFFQRALSLCERQIRHGPSLESVQLLLLMSQYLQGTERSIETWNIHGLAIKTAYQLGLHSPNALRQFPEKEREIRKRTWFGCVLLDRTLSMTLGRPPSIPENFIKLDLPYPLAHISSPGTGSASSIRAQQSVGFYNATISLYRIMGEVLDVLYGSNIGCDDSGNVFETASNVLQFEQKLFAWQNTLPTMLSLVQPETFLPNADSISSLRFRFILTIRFLNLRVLTHRPILSQHLSILNRSKQTSSDLEHLTVLRQVGANSIRICVQSALNIISIVRKVICPPEPQRHLLGAWWFSLYYTFNAALVLFSTLLVEHEAGLQGHPPVFDNQDLSIQNLYQAIECISLLFKGNRMTEKCARYTSGLAQMLLVIYRQAGRSEPETALPLPIDSLGSLPLPDDFGNLQPIDEFNFPDPNDLYIGMTLDDFFGVEFGSTSSHRDVNL